MYRSMSVRVSVHPVPPPRAKTKRKTKIGKKGPLDTSTSWTNFKVKGSKVKVSCLAGFSYVLRPLGPPNIFNKFTPMLTLQRFVQ